MRPILVSSQRRCAGGAENAEYDEKGACKIQITTGRSNSWFRCMYGALMISRQSVIPPSCSSLSSLSLHVGGERRQIIGEKGGNERYLVRMVSTHGGGENEE